MPILFIEYIEAIASSYKEQLDAGTLSPLLADPTTANLRDACLNTYNERKRKAEPLEEHILTAFFKEPRDGRNLYEHMEYYPVDRFKPLQRLIRKAIQEPNLRIVELFAWLINFQPRPFSNAQRVLNNPANSKTIDTEMPHRPTAGTNDALFTKLGIPIIITADDLLKYKREEKQGENEDKKEQKQESGQEYKKQEEGFSFGKGDKPPNIKIRTAALVGLGVVILSGGIYSFWKYTKTDKNACLYWTGDHYEARSCDEQLNDWQAVPNNGAYNKNLQKITRKDTITEWSIGRIYYISDTERNGEEEKIEYYTAGGPYPYDTKRNLRKLTRTIFENDSANRKPQASKINHQ